METNETKFEESEEINSSKIQRSFIFDKKEEPGGIKKNFRLPSLDLLEKNNSTMNN